MSQALRTCSTAEHYTPEKYVEAARRVLGAIDLDPASCEIANRTVRAARFYTVLDGGQHLPWDGRVFVNPPGDRRGLLPRAFWRRACEHALYGGEGSVVIWAGYSLEQLQSLQRADEIHGHRCPAPLHFPLVVVRRRIDWVCGLEPTVQLGLGFDDEPEREVGIAQGSPTHGNFFCLLGGDDAMRNRFHVTFGQFGSYSPGGY